MTDYDTIQELRAELSCCDDPAERAQIEAELRACQARQARLDEAFGEWLARLE